MIVDVHFESWIIAYFDRHLILIDQQRIALLWLAEKNVILIGTSDDSFSSFKETISFTKHVHIIIIIRIIPAVVMKGHTLWALKTQFRANAYLNFGIQC